MQNKLSQNEMFITMSALKKAITHLNNDKEQLDNEIINLKCQLSSLQFEYKKEYEKL
jgi:chaperonin cofactor prefoldin